MRLSVLTFCISISAAAGAKTYPVDGLVVAVERREPSVTVSHRPIPKFMPAMTMKFAVASARDLDPVEAGMRIRFELEVNGGSAVARRIRPMSAASGDMASVRRPKAGDMLPDFHLIDQTGAQRSLSGLRGRVVALTFVYTRCPLADVCPRLSATFAVLQKRFREQLGKQVQLVSITVDPLHDTPQRLAEYGKIWRADAAGWWFLTGGEPEISAFAQALGLVYWPEEGSITHSVMTAVIDRDGRLAALVEGAQHRPEQIADLIRAQMEER